MLAARRTLLFFAMQRKLLYLRKTPAQSAAIFYVLIVGLVLLPCDWLGGFFFEGEKAAHFFGTGVLRLAMFAVMLALSFHAGIAGTALPQKGRGVALLWGLPAFAVAVNNFPLVALAQGTAVIGRNAQLLALYALYCLGIGLFEEQAFRGVIFPLVLGKTGTGKKGRVLAVLLSSAAFGLLHLVNLLGGVSPAVFLQVGYSFLIGAMLAVCMFCGTGTLFCALAHALFNFGGNVVVYCGIGAFSDIWCPEEIVLTAAVGLAAAAYFVWLCLRSPSAAAEAFAVYPPASGGKDAPRGESGGNATGGGESPAEALPRGGEEGPRHTN